MYGYWHATTVVGFTADADVWCKECASLVYDRRDSEGVLRTVNDAREGFQGIDSEGNIVHPIFAGDEGANVERCNRCQEWLIDGPDCLEFRTDGTCIHSSHMTEAGF